MTSIAEKVLVIHDSNPISFDVWIILSCTLLLIYFVITTVYDIRYEKKIEEFKRNYKSNKGTEKEASIKEKGHIRKGILKQRFRFIIRVSIPAFCTIFILNYVIAATTVETGSMESKLVVGNLAVYNRWGYKKEVPERGDIILYHSDELNVEMAKRVIGIPGDHIQFVDGFVFINGQRVDESEYIAPDVETNCFEAFDVPEDTVFVLGDNRKYSYDSRFFNQPYIPYKKIIGKYMGQSKFNAKYWMEQHVLPKSHKAGK